MSVRCGIGYDLHRLETGRKLIVGGIELPFDKGPVGHSDGDVLAHALCDALLGAAGLGDIGTHFPDTDPKWKGADSAVFLEEALRRSQQAGFAVANVDSTLILTAPKIGPHALAIRTCVAGLLHISPEQVSVKAKTPEGMGTDNAAIAHAVVLLEKIDGDSTRRKPAKRKP